VMFYDYYQNTWLYKPKDDEAYEKFKDSTKWYTYGPPYRPDSNAASAPSQSASAPHDHKSSRS
jgi:hypothetical protein